MGCTPSHSDFANTIARSGLKALNKPKSILRIDPGDKGIPLLVKGSACYSIDEYNQYGIQRKDYPAEKEEQDRNDSLQLSSKAHLDPQISKEDRKIERAATDAEAVMSQLIESQKHITETIQIKKQSSCESEALAFIWDDKNEGNPKQIPKKGKKQKNKLAKQGRPSKIKEKSILPPCEAEKKVDFPELLVKAHQSAYAYLNPNLSKYEAILHVANQATQTQLFLQQMVSFLVLCFDEINQLLEEIANDGESLLKDIGGNLAWPAEKGDLKEHPDLLQQLLQYTVNKMQLLSRTLASLTSDALQETCSYLQSAASNLEGKLKAKQSFDERLLRMVRLLEASTVGSSQSHGDDRTLCSEDSGIGVDNESLKEFSALNQHGGQASCDFCAHGHLSQKHSRTMDHVHDTTKSPGTPATHDYALERRFKGMFYSSMQSREAASQARVPEGISTMPQCASRYYNSFQSDSTQESEHFKICESTDFPDDDDDDDDEEESTLGEDDDNTSLSDMWKDALPRRMSLPTVTDNTQRQFIKRTENAETEEIILKMKDAISEKIKFVPAKSGHKEWIEDEGGRAVQTTRPSTATGCQKNFRKQQRSRSEESLRSQAEDPTLLELQRTQKELGKRLEMFYGKKDTDDNPEPWKSRTAPYLASEQVATRSSSKLKACLSKNFSILPNQDKVPLFKADQNPASQLDEKRGRKPLRATVPTQETSGSKGKEPPATQNLSGSSCAPRQSVKKLIETFSPADDLVKDASLRSLGPIKCIRKFGLPVIPPAIPFHRGLPHLNVKNRISPVEDENPSSSFPNASPPEPAAELSKKDAKEETDEDIENLPPPPPEMLMDASFDSSEPEETARTERRSSEDAKKPTKTEFHTTKRAQVSPKMKASLQSIDLLPNKNTSGPGAITNKCLRNNGLVDEKLQNYSLELNPTNVRIPSQEEILATQRKEAADLYKQTHKIIPLQNPSGVSKPHSSSSESKEPSSPVTSVQYQKRGSPDSLRRNEKGSAFARKVSPTRTPPPSPPVEKKLVSPPMHHRRSLQPFSNPQPSSPTMQRKPSPPTSPRVPTPPLQKKMPSPPPHRKPVSPPAGHKQSSPTPYQLLGSPAYRRDASPPPLPIAPSPPASPSRLYKGSSAGLDAGGEHPLSSSKRSSNLRSIFCPASSSLFEARSPLVPTKPVAEVTSQPEASLLSQKSNLLFRQPGDRARKLSLSASSPQPFVRRSFSDRRPGVQFRLPAPVTASSDPALNQASMEESPRKAGDSWNSLYVPEIKDTSRSASHPELYVVGQGLQKD
ncbi:photoreceptor cilium actin regulator [Phaenicophaeus curvirostris]|uniref:photoreceptor cilium actin regulator n=1 Tax=Phaenicophaeus curvirostris TaxID=33595 RepID=UPI0037F0D35E